MGKWIKISLGELGTTYTGLSGKKKENFGKGKPYIPYMNIFSNTKVDPKHLELVEVRKGEKQNIIQKGDIFFTTSSETVDEVGMTSVLTEEIGEVYLNSFCFGFRPHDTSLILPEFIAYLLRSEKLRRQISFNGQGSTRYNISKRELLKNVVLKFPECRNEQATIATILTTIDQAIEKTEQIIAKYERIKTGLMQDLLTRGIDEEGNIRSEETHEFKDSPLGRIPAEWEVGNIETYLKKIIDYRGKTPIKSESGVPLITAKVVRLGYLQTPNEFIPIKNYKSWMTRGIPNTGDVLFTTEAPLGNVAQVPEWEIALGQRIITLQTTESLLSDYLFYLLMFPLVRTQFLKLSSGSTVTGIKQSQFRRIKIFVPNIQEQERVAKILKQIDSEIISEKYTLEKYETLKTGLMQDLLTGKVRVDALMKEKVI